MRNIYGILIILFISGIGAAQAQSSMHYRSSDNPYYWKNRKPHAEYWQQDVHYDIKARIDEELHKIEGSIKMDYWNNSPDTLNELYFHLFQNAFVKGSYLHQLEKENKVKARLGAMEAAGKGVIIQHIAQGNTVLESTLDNTLLKVKLKQAIIPGAHTQIAIQFETYYDRGGTRRRMQMYDAWGFMHYNGVQWFPKVCVYDAKMGWDTYQHLNKEFYGEFGSYDVSLDFPSNYIVEATGQLENREEVLPAALRAKLDVKNFANKKWDEAPSIIIPYQKGARKVWHFYAENVHDFAFTADPSYRIATTYWKGIECVGLVQEPHASGWQNSAEYVAKIIKTFSEDFGHYAYPKMVAADARDGMEYPMLTLDGGKSPSYNGLLVHEIGHNWFYGMVGSNETYRAAMDEGFTQFLTAWGLSKIDGPIIPKSKGKPYWKNKFSESSRQVDKSVFNAYHYDALQQNEVPLNTHSDDFNSALGHGGGYRLVYYKTASMLYNLQYTLGDSLFAAAMQHYFNQWKIAHPYFEDFKKSIMDFTKVDLNWFFDQWFETTKTTDYAIGRIQKVQGDSLFKIRFKRKSSMQMPIDFTVEAKDGKAYNFYIPNTWFEKQTDATVLPKWYGWGKLNPRYDALVNIPGGIKKVQIDTSMRLVDINMANNFKYRGLPISPDFIKLSWDGATSKAWDRKLYRLYAMPNLWWNAVDGIKIGAQLEGDYLFTLHKIKANIWWNSHIAQLAAYQAGAGQGTYDQYAALNYALQYTSPFSIKNPKLQLQLDSRFLDGLWYQKLGASWALSDHQIFSVYGLSMWRPLSYDKDYLFAPKEWSSTRAMPNSSINLAYNQQYRTMQSNGSWNVHFRAPFLTGNHSNSFQYSYAQLEWINRLNIDKLVLKTRLFGRYGMGQNIPYESALYAAGANPEEMMDDKLTRSIGWVPTNWYGDISRYNTNHFQYGGGLNLRGYNGYFLADERQNEVMIAYKGKSGAAINAELEFSNYFKFQPKFTKKWLQLSSYFFADAGIMQLSRYDSIQNYWNIKPTTMLSDLRVDAGLGFAFTIKKFGAFDKLKPLCLRLDLPMFINRPPYANPQYFNLRYVVGISRCF